MRKFNNGEEIIRPEIRGDVVVSPARERVGRRVPPGEIYSPPRAAMRRRNRKSIFERYRMFNGG